MPASNFSVIAPSRISLTILSAPAFGPKSKNITSASSDWVPCTRAKYEHAHPVRLTLFSLECRLFTHLCQHRRIQPLNKRWRLLEWVSNQLAFIPLQRFLLCTILFLSLPFPQWSLTAMITLSTSIPSTPNNQFPSFRCGLGPKRRERGRSMAVRVLSALRQPGYLISYFLFIVSPIYICSRSNRADW